MGTEARAPVRTTRERPVAERARPPSSPLEEFEQVYLRNVDVLMGYFARRCRDPHTVADLTSETFVRAVPRPAGTAESDPERTGPIEPVDQTVEQAAPQPAGVRRSRLVRRRRWGG
jgi:hypothetical protein